MARRYTKSASNGWKAAALLLAFLLACACTFGGLEIFGKGKAKPSNWGKKDAELAPVAISLESDAPFGAAQTLENGARAYPLVTAAAYDGLTADGFPATKRAKATCTLPDGTPTFEWSVTPDVAINTYDYGDYNEYVEITADEYFEDVVTLTANAYLNGTLRGTGSVSLYCRPKAPLEELETVKIGVLAATTGARPQTYVDYLQQFFAAIDETIKYETYDTEGFEADTIMRAIDKSQADAMDVIVFFDCYGAMVNAIESELMNIGPFVVIDNEKCFPEIVEAAGGCYVTNNINASELADAINDKYNGAGIEYPNVANFIPTSNTEMVYPFTEAFDGAYIQYQNYYATPEFQNRETYQMMLNTEANIICLPDMEHFAVFAQVIEETGRTTGDYAYIILDLNSQLYAMQGEQDPLEILDETGTLFYIAYERTIYIEDFYHAILGCMGFEEYPESAFFYQCNMITS